MSGKFCHLTELRNSQYSENTIGRNTRNSNELNNIACYRFNDCFSFSMFQNPKREQRRWKFLLPIPGFRSLIFRLLNSL